MIIKLNRKETIIDDEDFERIKDYHWFLYGQYAFTSKTKKKIKTPIYLHRFIMNCPKNKQVDHINGDKLDNRKSNLRICTRQQNLQNRTKSEHKSSIYKGVAWHKRDRVWRAYIKTDGKQICLGTFSTPQIAAYAYDRMAKIFFGKFANLNFKDGGESNNA